MTLKSDLSVVTKLNGRIFAVESASLGQMVRSKHVSFTHKQDGKHVCQFIPGDLIYVCTLCGTTKEK